jgi:hypothetical protein
MLRELWGCEQLTSCVDSLPPHSWRLSIALAGRDAGRGQPHPTQGMCRDPLPPARQSLGRYTALDMRMHMVPARWYSFCSGGLGVTFWSFPQPQNHTQSQKRRGCQITAYKTPSLFTLLYIGVARATHTLEAGRSAGDPSGSAKFSHSRRRGAVLQA